MLKTFYKQTVKNALIMLRKTIFINDFKGKIFFDLPSITQKIN